MQFDLIKISALFRSGEFAISPYADRRMQKGGISNELLVEAIGRDNPKIIEKYTYSCLILGWGLPNKPLHAVVALGTVDEEYDTPMLITVYKPDEDEKDRWKDNYAKRK